MKHPRHKSPPPPLDSGELQRLALAYVGRYATTRAKLRNYLERKLFERGWAGEGDPSCESLVEKMAGFGYIDDTAFALSRAASFTRRGLGARRLDDALRAAGVGEESREPAAEAARGDAWSAATRFAQRKGIGPYADAEADADRRRKQFGMMIRAGHPLPIVRALVHARPGEFPEEDNL